MRSLPLLSFLAFASHRALPFEISVASYQYNICNGLSNQLLYHAGHIAKAVAKRLAVEVPDHFIVNGVQSSDENVLPTESNSVGFGVAFDKDAFQKAIESLGIRVRFVPRTTDKENTKIPCTGMASLVGSDPDIVLFILQAFQPSAEVKHFVQSILENASHELSKGICVHHRNGEDWHEHCARWGSIPDKVYRGNCLGVPGRTFLESLEDRGLNRQNWIYYCGDHEIPTELRKYNVSSRSELLKPADLEIIEKIMPNSPIRDLWALIDFFVCGNLPHFIGNSVSTFSAVQIAARRGYGTFWYNSQSIPLSTIWPAYNVPIVYTYSETAAPNTKFMLQASIASVKTFMPRTPINVLYSGDRDAGFEQWLINQGVILHHLEPTRKEFGSGGGGEAEEWHSVYIPLHIESEYCLFMDADSLVVKSFTMADFGLNLTRSIALGSLDSSSRIMLISVPHMRRTLKDFTDSLQQYDANDLASLEHAYRNFYDVDVLSERFGSYPSSVNEADNQAFPFTIQNASVYFKQTLVDMDCSDKSCFAVAESPFLCRSFTAMSILFDTVEVPSYCHGLFTENTHIAERCISVMEKLQGNPPSTCREWDASFRVSPAKLRVLYKWRQVVLLVVCVGWWIFAKYRRRKQHVL